MNSFCSSHDLPLSPENTKALLEVLLHREDKNLPDTIPVTVNKKQKTVLCHFIIFYKINVYLKIYLLLEDIQRMSDSTHVILISVQC